MAVGADLDGGEVLDAGGCVLAPGLVDLHAHLRQPGHEEAETVETGSRAAALGGYTAVVAMPNTTPAIDSRGDGPRGARPRHGARCATCGWPGRSPSAGRGRSWPRSAEMAALGVRLFTDDGRGVQDARLMRRALEYASDLDVVLAQHCEDEAIAQGGVMHEGEWSSRLGLPGQPAEAEELMVQRDLALARLTGARIHFQHLSTARSVELVRAARAAGSAVTAEATPHHFTLTHAACAGYDPVFKVQPAAADRRRTSTAVRAGLADGTLDAIATDHAPHAPHLKELPFDQAPPGMLGLETALALALTELDLPIERVLALLSWQPAAIAGLSDLHGGPIEPGRPAHLCVIDPAHEWVVEPAALASRARNTPYAGRRLRGKVRHTLLGGELVVRDGEALR